MCVGDASIGSGPEVVDGPRLRRLLPERTSSDDPWIEAKQGKDQNHGRHNTIKHSQGMPGFPGTLDEHT